MKENKLERIYELAKSEEAQNVALKIANLLRSISLEKTDALSISAAATILIAMKSGQETLNKWESFFTYAFPDQVQLQQIIGTLSESDLKNTSDDILLAVITGVDNEINIHRFNEATPSFISDLALKLMKIGENKDVADLCCGIGNFLTKAKIKYPNNNFYGYELNSNNIAHMSLKSSLFDNYLHISEEDVFDINDKKFDFIFMNHPFGWRISQNDKALNYVKQFFEKPTMSSFSDWAFILKAVELLKDNGTLITLISNGCLYSGLDREYREMLMNYGYINTVISLPENMYNSTFIPVTMLVITKNINNRKFRFVDASNLYTKERRKNILSDKDINTIIDAIKNDTDISATASFDDIKLSDYNLVPARYIDNDLTKYDNAVEFNSIITKITRGAPLQSSELDKLTTNDQTDYQYLMLANIKNGIIDADLPYLKSIDAKYEKYCINNRSLLISKNGAPFKMAIAEVEKGKKILANGNLYIIEVDEEKANPYYLQAFFMSKAGQKLLNKFVVGSTIPNLPITDLKKAMIPLPSLEVQRKIAKEYASTIDEINVLNKKISQAKDRLSNCFKNGIKEA